MSSLSDQNRLVSILMPAYNCEKFVRQAIDSMLQQTYKNFELLIADDCSTDGTKALIDSYTDARIKRFHNKKNLGYLQASNKLFEKCSGALISFQDADDYASTERLEKLVGFLNDHPEIDCVGSNITKVDAEGNTFYITQYPLRQEEIEKEFLNFRIVMTGSALMLRKGVLEKTGLYNLYFDRIGSEDTYLYSKILDHFKVANIPEVLYYYRANPNSVGFTHKNPKAFVGHELIVRMHRRRRENKPDLIEAGDFKKTDEYVRFLLAMKAMESSKVKSLALFSKETLLHPAMGMEFVKEFAGKLIYKRQDRST